MRLKAFVAVATVAAGLGLIGLGQEPARADGSVTITSPSAGGALFEDDNVTVDASGVANVYCVVINDATGTQLGYTCPDSPPPDGVYTVQVSNLSPGVGQITADAQAEAGDVQSAPVTVLEDPGTYHPLTPQRVLDTRQDGSGGVAANSTTDFFASDAGVPSSADAVVFNLTETGASTGGYITAYTAGENRPTASNLNFAARQTIANLVTASTDYGDVTLYNGSSGAVQMIADVVGYYDTGTSSSPTAAGHFVSLTPARVLDTRSGVGRAGNSPVPAQATITVRMAGQGGVPASGATGVVFTLVVTQTRAPGNLRAFPQSAGSTETSSLNFVAGKDAGNLVALPLDASGDVDIQNYSSGASHVVADVVGYYTGASSIPTNSGLFVPTAPTRVLDTRYGTGGGTGPLAPQSSLTAVLSSLPSDALSGAALNTTATNTHGVGYLTIWPSGASRPVASELNFTAGLTTAEADLARLGDGNAVDVFNGSANPVDVILDVNGLFTGPAQ